MAPVAAWTLHAVLGIFPSGVNVATIIKSISSGEIWESLIAFIAALIDNVAVVSLFEILRSEMPVLSVIHSSLVSTMVLKYLFVTIFAGTAEPVPNIYDVISFLRS